MSFTLHINATALASLGLSTPATALRLRALRIEGFQTAHDWGIGHEIALRKKGAGINEGLLLELS